MAQVELNSFAKGLNNFLDPANIGTEYAYNLLDVSLDKGILKSTKGNRLTTFTDELELNHFGKANRSVAKQFGRHYWSINDAINAPYYGGDVMPLGIQPPDSLLTLQASEFEGEEDDEEKKKYPFLGTYSYCYTYVINGYESAPAKLSADYYTSITVKQANISYYFGELPENIQQVKVYRTIANGAEFYSLAIYDREVANGASFLDNLPDVDLLFGEPMECLYYLPPPDKGKFLIENQGTFFLAVDDKLYFSEIFNCHAWNPSNWISFEDDITGIINEFQGLLVFTRNRVYKVVGNDMSTIEKVEIPTHQGCVNNRTCATLSNAPIWLSNDGLCMWDGQSVKLISYGICKIDNQPIFALSANDCYYLFGKQNVIVFDTRMGGVFYRLSAKAEYGWYDADLDKVFYRYNNDIYILFGSHIDNYSFYTTGLLGAKTQKVEFRKIRVNSTNGFVLFIKDEKGRTKEYKIIEDVGIVEFYLPTSIWLSGYSFTFQFQGEIKEIILKTTDY